MRTNRTKHLLREGKIAFGSMIGHIRSPELPRMFAEAGLDWIFIDTEHGCYTIETVQDLVRTALLTPVTPIVRVADLQYSLICRCLDMGAEGIILPRVEDPDLLAKAISWMKFPPQGVRGFGLSSPQAGYTSASFPEIMEHYNRETLVVLQIETVAALERADELASARGVDAIMIGPADLSISLGVGGEFGHPKLAAAIDKVIGVCESHGVWPAIQVRNPQIAKTWARRGMKLIGCGTDLIVLWTAMQSMAAELRASAE